MKKASLLLLLLTGLLCKAQDYQCLKTGVKNYYTNSQGYLRGIRIDSVTTTGTGTIFYPFHTKRSTDTPTANGSWMGNKVQMLNDGSWLFYNIWHDTVVINSQAHASDSWIFYNDTTAIYYMATVLSTDTMTISGVLDSIKTIRINTYNGGIPDSTDHLNGMEMKLSKNNGFAQVFDLYTFPYKFTSMNPDYFCTATQNAPIFNITAFHNPTLIDVYNFSVGDGFERWTNTTIAWAYAAANPLNIDYEGMVYDTIISKNVPDAYHVEYALMHLGYQSEKDYDPSTLSGTNYISYNYMDTISVDTSTVFPQNTMPEEAPDMVLYYYHPSDTGTCSQNSIYIKSMPGGYLPKPSGLIINSPEWTDRAVYKTGYGATFTQSCLWAQDPPVETIYNDLVYSYKSGTSCGNYAPLAVPEANSPEKEISIYPNPATNTIKVSSPAGIRSISMNNLLGETLFERQYNSGNAQINIADLTPGIYLIKINGTEVRKFLKE